MTGRDLIRIIQENGLENLRIEDAYDMDIVFDAGTSVDDDHIVRYNFKIIDIFEGTVTDKTS